MAKRGLLIERNNRKKKMNWKISHQYEGMSNEEEVWKESSSLEQQFLVTNRKCHLPEKLLLTCLNASSFKGSPKSLRRKSLNRPTRGAAGGDITFHSHFPSAIQIWHRWLANDCHCQKSVEDCHYQRPIGLLRNEFYSQSGYRYCKSSQRSKYYRTAGEPLSITRCKAHPMRDGKAPSASACNWNPPLARWWDDCFAPSSVADLPWALSHFHFSQLPTTSPAPFTSLGSKTEAILYFPLLSFPPGWFQLPESG